MHFFGCESFVLKTFLSCLADKESTGDIDKALQRPNNCALENIFRKRHKSFYKRSKSVNFLHEILHKVWFCSDFCKVVKL